MILCNFPACILRTLHYYNSPDWPSCHSSRDCYCSLVGESNTTSQWRHNERDGVWNHWRFDCLLKCLFRGRSKKISKHRVTGLCEGNPSVTGGFPSQRVSNAENVFIYDVIMKCFCILSIEKPSKLYIAPPLWQESTKWILHTKCQLCRKCVNVVTGQCQLLSWESQYLEI